MGNQNLIPSFFREDEFDEPSSPTDNKKQKKEVNKKKPPTKRRSKKLKIMKSNSSNYANMDVQAFRSMFDNKVPVVLGFLTSETKLNTVDNPVGRLADQNSSRKSLAIRKKQRLGSRVFPCASYCRTCRKVKLACSSLCGNKKIIVRKNSSIVRKKSAQFM